MSTSTTPETGSSRGTRPSNRKRTGWVVATNGTAAQDRATVEVTGEQAIMRSSQFGRAIVGPVLRDVIA